MTLDTIACADARDWLATLADNSIDMGLTSPPYGNLRSYNGYSWDFEAIAQQAYRVLKPGGVLVWVVSDVIVDGSETLTSFKQALYFKEMCGFNIQTIIWEKPSGAPGKFNKRLDRVFEYMFVCSKGEIATFNPPMVCTKTYGRRNVRNRTSSLDGWKKKEGYSHVKPFKVDSNIWLFDHGFGRTSTDGTNDHPAMFPELLAERHILTWSNPGDTVMDFFMGSGTTAKMAWKNNRHYIGCDVSQAYVTLAQRRLANTDPYRDTVNADGSIQLSLFSADGGPATVEPNSTNGTSMEYK